MSEQPQTNGWMACGVLTLVVVGIWLVAAYPAYVIDPDYGLEGLTYSALLVLVPGWLVFIATDVYRVASTPLGKIGVGITARMVFALGGYLAIKGVRPEFGLRNFGLWLMTFYFATLALETRQAASSLKDDPPPPNGNGASSPS